MKLVIAVLGLVACVSPAAEAQVTLDVSKITCDQCFRSTITNPQNIALWLSGYYNAKRNNTVIDIQGFEADTRKLEDYCTAHPQIPVMRAVETVFGASK